MIFNKTLVTFIIILLAGNLFFGYQYLSGKSVSNTESVGGERTETAKTAAFLQLFVVKVLQAEGEVSFEDRLQLENAVRDLNDEKILDQWQKFVDSESEANAQANFRLLLQMLVQKLG